MYEKIAILAVFAGIYSVAAGRIERTPINGALVFVLFGLIMGPMGFGVFGDLKQAEALKLIAELSLALVLFVDASKVNFTVLAQARALPVRLIFVGLPMSILLGFLAGLALIDGVTALGLALMATLLAPTDAALGKPVVTSEAVPGRIREGLSFESGLNDGVCVPIFLALLALTIGEAEGGEFGTLLFELVVHEIGIGALTGLAIAFGAALVFRACHRKGWIRQGQTHVPVAATAIAAFTAAQAFHGSGFIAAFVGGLLFGWMAGEKSHELTEPAEAAGDALTMITWIAFGAGLVWQMHHAFTWQVVVYALLSLTVIRMLPVWLVLRGQSLHLPEILFIGWFGPRGLATVVFAMIVATNPVPGAETIVATATCTVLLSVVLHGVTALPVIRRLFGTA